MYLGPNNVKITIFLKFRHFWLIARPSCEMSSEMTNFPYFRGPELLISQEDRAISQKWQNFKENGVFILFGLIFINKVGGEHDLRIGHFDAHP